MSEIKSCKVTVPPSLQLGEYCNALRVIHDGGSEWFLDFMMISPSEGAAKVVSRIRIQQPFISSIRDRLTSVLEQIKDSTQEEGAGVQFIGKPPQGLQ